MKSNYGARLLVSCLLVAAAACDNGQNKGGKGDGGDGGGGGSGINVTVTISGEGSVAVDGTDVCTSATDPCTLNVVIGSTTTITATPGEGFQFSSWNCSGTISTNATLDLVLASGAACTVTFLPISETLMVSISDGRGGSGGGVVNAGTIMCGPGTSNVCSNDYDYGTMVTLIASPLPNFEFVGWEGDCTGTDTTISFVIVEPMTCVAHFEHIQFPLTLSVVGNGTLFASASSASGSCAQATCPAIDVDSPEVVTLTAQPGIGSEIAAWTGDCVADASQNITQVTMSAARTCVVTFGASDRSLVLATTGGGTITHTPDGTDTGSAFVFANGTSVTLDAVADPNRVFLNWSGCSTSTDAHLVLTMDADKSCTANFGPAQRTLTVTAIGPGTVTSAPAGIDTGAADTSQSYDHGTPVTLTATPTSGFEVAAWGGDCANSDDPVPTTFDLTMSANRTCTVTFKALLTVVVVGSGSVKSDVDHVGIDTLNNKYDALYDPSAMVTLTATVNTGGPQVSFLGWSGDCSGTADTTMVTLSASKTCTATFTITPYDLTVAVAPSGGGNVVGQRNGTGSTVVNCGTGGSDCGDTGVPSNEFVRLVATPAAGYRFDAWSNCSTDTTTTLDVPMNNNKTCTANFTKQWTVTLTTLTGSGTVTIDRASTGTSPDKTCSAGNCAQIVDSDETTTVTAIPANSETRISAFSCSAGSLSGSVYTIANPTADVTCTVTFAPKTVTVVGAGTNGSVAPASTVVNSGGAGVQLTATANANYHFTGWSGSFTSGSGTAAGCTGSSNPITVTISGATHGATYTCTASFAINNVTIVGAAGSNGSVAPVSTATTVGAAATTLTATPSANYHVSGWSGSFTTGSGTATGCSGSATTANVQVTGGTQNAVYTCTASFAINGVTIVGASGSNGSVAPASTSTSVGAAATTLTATPSASYHVTGWSGSFTTGSGTATGCTGSATTASVAITAGTQGAVYTCTATFGINNVTIAGTPGSNGSVAPASTATTVGAAATTLTATPNASYSVSGWSGSFTSGSGTASGCSGSGTTVNVSISAATQNAVYTCQASFAINAVTIAGTAGSNGSVAPITTATTVGAAATTLTATPSANYHVSGWAGSFTSGSGTASGCSGSGATVDVSISAATSGAVYTCQATFAINNVTIAGAPGSGASTVSPTSTATTVGAAATTLTASPAANNHVTGWSGSFTSGSGTASGCSGSTTTVSVSISAATQNAVYTCTASFAINNVTIAGAPGSGASTVSPTSTATTVGAAATTLTATPAANNHVTGWSGSFTTGSGTATGCSGSATTASVAITAATQNAVYTCTASFAINNVTIAGAPTSGGNGTVAPASTATTVGAAATTLTATANTNYRVTGWSGSFTSGSGTATGCTGAATTTTVAITAGTQNAVFTCTASFTINTVTIVGAGTNGTVSPASTVVNSGSGTTLTATPSAGYRFDSWSGGYTSGSGSASGCTGTASSVFVSVSGATNGAVYTCTATFAPLWVRGYFANVAARDGLGYSIGIFDLGDSFALGALDWLSKGPHHWMATLGLDGRPAADGIYVDTNNAALTPRRVVKHIDSGYVVFGEVNGTDYLVPLDKNYGINDTPRNYPNQTYTSVVMNDAASSPASRTYATVGVGVYPNGRIEIPYGHVVVRTEDYNPVFDAVFGCAKDSPTAGPWVEQSNVTAVAATRDGDYLVAGTLTFRNAQGLDYLALMIARVGPGGNLRWVRSYHVADADKGVTGNSLFPSSILEDQNGNVLVVGGFQQSYLTGAWWGFSTLVSGEDGTAKWAGGDHVVVYYEGSTAVYLKAAVNAGSDFLVGGTYFNGRTNSGSEALVAAINSKTGDLSLARIYGGLQDDFNGLPAFIDGGSEAPPTTILAGYRPTHIDTAQGAGWVIAGNTSSFAASGADSGERPWVIRVDGALITGPQLHKDYFDKTLKLSSEIMWAPVAVNLDPADTCTMVAVPASAASALDLGSATIKMGYGAHAGNP